MFPKTLRKLLTKDRLPKLSDTASQYARLEIIYQLIGRPFDSTKADIVFLMELPFIGQEKDMFEMLLPILARQEDAVSQISDVKKGKSTTITFRKKKRGGNYKEGEQK